MALHPDFPVSPYAVLLPDQRWFPAAEELRSTAYEKLLPPLVAKIRSEVEVWRNTGYAGASATSQALLRWWFETDHLIEQADGTLARFRYYFAQREPVQREIDLPTEYEERWTGSYIFENEWQSFRTRQNRKLELVTAPHTYEKPGHYIVAVKVIDTFGNDTMTLVPVSVG